MLTKVLLQDGDESIDNFIRQGLTIAQPLPEKGYNDSFTSEIVAHLLSSGVANSCISHSSNSNESRT
jgi:hypothetical protein